MTDTLTYVLATIKRTSENDYSWVLMPHEALALLAEVERLRAEVAWLRSDILPTEPCAACGHAKRTHQDYRDYAGHDVTRCWGGGFDRDDCGARCGRFVRFEKETP